MHTLSELEKLPVELLYEIQLFALSEALPILDKRTHEIFKATPSSFRAEYIFRRYLLPTPTKIKKRGIVTYALRFPLCSEAVLDAVLRLSADDPVTQNQEDVPPELPKRLFKPLTPRVGSARWSRFDAPLPFLRDLYTNARIRPPDPNAHDGYALSRAVHAGFHPLVEFLLNCGATPKQKDALAVRLAIKKRDLVLVRALIEREEGDDCAAGGGDGSRGQSGRGGAEPKVTMKRGTKRRRLTDRVEVTTEMLRLAVEADARDIVEYLLEKGARPDMRTIKRMRISGLM
ncbi:hypothetical protein DFH11DRAFT_1689858 [Phellopilus nigrolimitatus]|nr:hypothetical protein DFH11DRAFT_1689858 [Phellopilus nigrolimitatus]